jgi:hypothetical protein
MDLTGAQTPGGIFVYRNASRVRIQWKPQKAHKPGEQKKSQSDFRNPGFDALHGQELGPIKLYLFGGFDEGPIQIIRCG